MVALCATVSLFGQSPNDAAALKIPPKQTSEEQAVLPAAQAVSTKEDKATLRQKVAQLRQKAEDNRGTEAARDSAIEEALTLVKLAPDGIPEENDRRRALVAQLVADGSVPNDKRFQLLAISANTDVALNRTLKPEQKLAAFEQVAWSLVSDFPENPEGYESLLRIAQDSDDAQARSIATRLAASSASERVKAGAKDVLERLNLVGKPLSELFPMELAHLVRNKKAVCLVTWTARHPHSLSLVKGLRASLPSDATLLAVCLDEDVQPARRIFEAQKLTAEPVYSADGLRSRLYQQLHFDRPGQVYLADAESRITTVAGLKKLMKERSEKGRATR